METCTAPAAPGGRDVPLTPPQPRDHPGTPDYIPSPDAGRPAPSRGRPLCLLSPTGTACPRHGWHRDLQGSNGAPGHAPGRLQEVMAIDPKRGAGSAAALPRGWGLSTTRAWCREGLRHATAGSAAASTLALRALDERGLHAPQRAPQRGDGAREPRKGSGSPAPAPSPGLGAGDERAAGRQLCQQLTDSRPAISCSASPGRELQRAAPCL